jgi:hypothetical protein
MLGRDAARFKVLPLEPSQHLDVQTVNASVVNNADLALMNNQIIRAYPHLLAYTMIRV